MELQIVKLGTSSTVNTHEGALSSVSLPHETLYRGGDTSHTGCGVGLFEALSRILDFAEALGLDPLEFLGDCHLHHRNEVGARHECQESLDFVVELLARREQNLIT